LDTTVVVNFSIGLVKLVDKLIACLYTIDTVFSWVVLFSGTPEEKKPNDDGNEKWNPMAKS